MTPDINLRDSKEVYDQQADAFASKAPTLLTYEFIGKPFIQKALTETIEDPAKTKTLDVGSASGRIVQLMIENGIPAANVTGVEISPNEVEIARRQIPGATFEVGDIRNHKLPKGKFDIVTSYMVWEFLDEKGLDEAFQNIFGALKPGGKFIYGTTNPKRYTAKYGVTKEGWVQTGGPWGGSFENWFRPVGKFIEQTEKAGFVVEKVEELAMPAEATEKYPDKMKDFNDFGVPVRLAVIAHKPTE